MVVHVDDGDSIIVELDGADHRVRLIGINAPERDECQGPDARRSLTDLIEGRQVFLETDVEDTDQFGRLLRYVWDGDTLINAEMARLGLAIARPFEPNTTRQNALGEAEQAARSEGLGIWDRTACGAADTGAELRIVGVSANPNGRDEENLNGEYVIIENVGADVDLGGHILRDGSTVHRFEFPSGYILESGSEVVVFVGCGVNTMSEVYWCSDGPVWDNGGDEAFLLTPEGAFISTYAYP